VLEDRDLGDPLALRAVREAMQFELNAFHFYRMARERIQNPQNRIILEQLYENEVDHLHELEEKYHAHLDPSVIDLDPSAEKRLSEWLFRDIVFTDETAAPRIYEMAIEMERRTRDHFRKAAADAAEGSQEREIYLELAAEEEEHVALLEAEMEQFK
jgi:rubrerythrin